MWSTGPAVAGMTAGERTEATRRKILTAACEVIADLGFEGVRMRIVADRAEVSSALLHYHFDNREKLFLAAMRYSFEHAGSEVPDPPATVGMATWRLARVIDACLPLDAELRRDFLLWQELWLRGSRDADSRSLAQQLFGELREWAGSAIREGIAAGEFTSCDVAAVSDLLLALADGYGIRMVLGDPAVTGGHARGQIWAAVSGKLGITEPFPVPPGCG